MPRLHYTLILGCRGGQWLPLYRGKGGVLNGQSEENSVLPKTRSLFFFWVFVAIPDGEDSGIKLLPHSLGIWAEHDTSYHRGRGQTGCLINSTTSSYINDIFINKRICPVAHVKAHLDLGWPAMTLNNWGMVLMCWVLHIQEQHGKLQLWHEGKLLSAHNIFTHQSIFPCMGNWPGAYQCVAGSVLQPHLWSIFL